MKLEFLSEGSRDCPLIRLYQFDQPEAKQLKAIFESMAAGSQQRLALHEEPWIEAIGECRLDLEVGIRDCGVIQRGPMRFEYVLKEDSWSDLALLVEPFYRDEPGVYQWLNERGKVSLLLSKDGKW